MTSTWVLVVLFMSSGMFHDRPSLYVDTGRFPTVEACNARYNEILGNRGVWQGVGSSGIFSSTCVEVRSR